MSNSGSRHQQQWAPFPVQDWTSYARRHRAWRRTRRTPWRAVVATLVLLLIAGSVLVAVDSPARSLDERRSSTNPWVPADGHSATRSGTVSGAGEDPGPVTPAQITDAQITDALEALPAASQNLPTTLAGIVLWAAGGQIDSTIWRRITASEGSDAFEAYLVTDEVRLLAVSHPHVEGIGAVEGFGTGDGSPGGVLLLPAGVAAGDHWSSGGITATEVAWSAEFTAAPGAGPECLEISGELRIADQPIQLSQQWCHGRGIVAASRTDPDGTRTSWQPAEPGEPAAEQLSTGETEPAPGSVADWVLGARSTMTELPGLDPEPMNGAIGNHPPLRTGDGQIVVSTRADVIVTETAGSDTLVARHRLHPGGTLVSVGVFGEVVVATTSAREAVAWSASTGRELWRQRLPDISDPELLRLDSGALLIAGVSGDLLAIELVDGTRRWHSRVQVTSGFPAAVGGYGVAAAVPAGGIALLDPGTGEPRWRWDFDGIIDQIVAAPSTVWIFTDAGLFGVDPMTGEQTVDRRISRDGPAVVLGELLIVPGPGTLEAYAPDGSEQWLLPTGCELLLPRADELLCWQTDQVIAIDAAGTQVARQPVTSHVPGQLRAAVSADGAAWQVNTGDAEHSWEVHTWQR